MNSQPLRLVVVCSEDARRRLLSHLAERAWFDRLPRLAHDGAVVTI